MSFEIPGPEDFSFEIRNGEGSFSFDSLSEAPPAAQVVFLTSVLAQASEFVQQIGDASAYLVESDDFDEGFFTDEGECALLDVHSLSGFDTAVHEALVSVNVAMDTPLVQQMSSFDGAGTALSGEVFEVLADISRMSLEVHGMWHEFIDVVQMPGPGFSLGEVQEAARGVFPVLRDLCGEFLELVEALLSSDELSEFTDGAMRAFLDSAREY